MEKSAEHRRLIRWELDHWDDPVLDDFHLVLEFVGVCSPNNPDGRAIARRYNADKVALWDHAQQALFTELFRKLLHEAKVSAAEQRTLLVRQLQKYTPTTREHVLRKFEAYFTRLELHYLRWVNQTPAGDIQDFLAQAPGFTLPHRRGGLRKKAENKQKANSVLAYLKDLVAKRIDFLFSRFSDDARKRAKDKHLLGPIFFFQLLHPVLEQELKQKLESVCNNASRRRQKVLAALTEVFGTLDGIPQDKLSAWALSSPKEIALEMTVWLYGGKVSTLEKRLSEDNHVPAFMRIWSLALYADLRETVRLSIDRAIHQELQDLHAAVLS